MRLTRKRALLVPSSIAPTRGPYFPCTTGISTQRKITNSTTMQIQKIVIFYMEWICQAFPAKHVESKSYDGTDQGRTLVFPSGVGADKMKIHDRSGCSADFGQTLAGRKQVDDRSVLDVSRFQDYRILW